MTYELIIERRQPPCGGKPPRLFEFFTVETNNPEQYVRSHEPELPCDIAMDVSDDGHGTITVSFVRGVQNVRYEFTEA